MNLGEPWARSGFVLQLMTEMLLMFMIQCDAGDDGKDDANRYTFFVLQGVLLLLIN